MFGWLKATSEEGKLKVDKSAAVFYFLKLFPRDSLEELKYALLTTLIHSFNKYLKLGWIDAPEVMNMLQKGIDVQAFLKPQYRNTYTDQTIYREISLKLQELSRLISFVRDKFADTSQIEYPHVIDEEMKLLFETAMRERSFWTKSKLELKEESSNLKC